RVFTISTKTAEGLNELKFAMADVVETRRATLPEPEPSPVIRPKALARKRGSVAQFTIEKKGDGDGGFVWRVRGDKPERWIRQTD
ncbi:GTPase ObgE, partial [Acinetobacter baumannii]